MLASSAAPHSALPAILRGFSLPPRLNPSDWCEQHVILPPGSAMPGKFRFAQTPYLREPFDCLGQQSPVRKVVIVGGAQIGKTQLLLNALAFWIATDPRPIMAVWPTVEVAKRLVRTRVEPTFDAIPSVKAKLAPDRSRDKSNTVFLKSLIGGSELIVVGANAPAPLRSSPVNYILLDEVSAYGPTLEGDVLDLVEERQNTYRLTAKTLAISTPLDAETCLISRAYEATEKSRYQLPCLQCGHHWAPGFSDIQWPKHQPEKAVLVCPSCGRPHDDFDKSIMLPNGRWQATAPHTDPTVRGFHVPGLISPWLSFGRIAKRHSDAGKDPVRLRVFVNATLAETWEDQSGEDLPETPLLERRETWPDDCVPPGVVAITGGIDTQDDRLECSLIGWGAGEEAWLLGHHVLWGDPSGNAVWEALDSLLQRTWRHPRAVPDLRVSAACLDSGGHHTLRVYDFCRARAGRRVWAIKGQSIPGRPLWPRKASRNNKGKVDLFNINTLAAKDALFSRLRLEEPGPGFIHFHSSLGPDYFAGLASERAVVKYHRGKSMRVWVPISDRRNEPLDCAVYGLAALHSLKVGGLNLDREAAAVQAAPERGTPEAIAQERRRNKNTANQTARSNDSGAVRSSWVHGR